MAERPKMTNIIYLSSLCLWLIYSVYIQLHVKSQQNSVEMLIQFLKTLNTC